MRRGHDASPALAVSRSDPARSARGRVADKHSKAPGADRLFQRFPSVDGSLYYVGGVGVNYQQRGNIVLAPIRLGVGLRAGASIGYMHYTRKKTLNPF